MVRIGLFILLLTLTTSCSVLNEFYLSNPTELPVTVRLQFDRNIYFERFESAFLKSTRFQKNIASEAYQHFERTLPFTKEADGTFSFEIPAHTTAFLGFSTNGHPLTEKIIYTKNGVSTTITAQNFKEHSEIKDNFISHIRIVIKIK